MRGLKCIKPKLHKNNLAQRVILELKQKLKKKQKLTQIDKFKKKLYCPKVRVRGNNSYTNYRKIKLTNETIITKMINIIIILVNIIHIIK